MYRSATIHIKWWLKVLSISWTVVGSSLFFDWRDAPFLSWAWSIGFVVGGVAAWMLSRDIANRRLSELTAGLVLAPVWARSVYVIVLGQHLAFQSRVIAGTIWLFIALTLTLRWRALVGLPGTLQELGVITNDERS